MITLLISKVVVCSNAQSSSISSISCLHMSPWQLGRYLWAQRDLQGGDKNLKVSEQYLQAGYEYSKPEQLESWTLINKALGSETTTYKEEQDVKPLCIHKVDLDNIGKLG